MGQNTDVILALLRHGLRARLAHSNAMAISEGGKYDRIAGEGYGELRRTQPQGAPDLHAGQRYVCLLYTSKERR